MGINGKELSPLPTRLHAERPVNNAMANKLNLFFMIIVDFVKGKFELVINKDWQKTAFLKEN